MNEYPTFTPRRATWSFMGLHPLRLIALGFGSGLSPVAPGTAGTLAGWGLYLLIDRFVAPTHLAWAAILVAGFLIGWWACMHTAREMAVSDPSAVVWDEIIAFWIILWVVMPVGWADSLFKPRRGELPGWPQGLGIIFDDLVAAVCTLVVFYAGRWGWTTWH